MRGLGFCVVVFGGFLCVLLVSFLCACAGWGDCLISKASIQKLHSSD